MKQWLHIPYWLEPVRFFVLLALGFGLAFIVITPPFQGADEPVHLFRTYQISTGRLSVEESGKYGIGHLPKSIGATMDAVGPSIQFKPGAKYGERKTLNALHIKLDANNTQPYDLTPTASYSPIAYIPAAAAVLVGRLLDLPPILLLYGARLANLFAWLILLALAIKLIPYKKWAVVFVGLLPMALFQAATLNTDPVTIGSLALFLALILNIRATQDKQLKLKIIWLAIVSLMMALSKQLMFIFLPLVFLLSNKMIIGKYRPYILKGSLVLVPFLLCIGWLLLIQPVDPSITAANQQNPPAQLKFIVSSPESFINTLWNTYFYTWGDGITRSIIGTFGWADTPLSEAIVVFGYICLALVLLGRIDQKSFNLNKYEKLLVGGLAAVYFLALSATLYMYYNPVGFKIIVGLQGRYYLPLLLLAIPLLAGTKWLKVEKKAYLRIAIGAPIILLMSSTLTLFARYVISNV